MGGDSFDERTVLGHARPSHARRDCLGLFERVAQRRLERFEEKTERTIVGGRGEAEVEFR